MHTSQYSENTRPGKALWGCLLAMLWSTALMAAGPDVKGLVLYLPMEDAKKPIDASANPTTVAVHGASISSMGRSGPRHCSSMAATRTFWRSRMPPNCRG